MKRTLLLTLTCFSLLTPQDVLGQTNEDRIASLQREIAAQAQRISRLEAEVARLTAALGVTPAPQPTGARSRVAPRGAWMTAAPWGRIKRGMSEQRVISILGSPTKREAAGTMLTLFYQGEVAGSGYVSGNIGLWSRENRVFSINIPVF
jgi:hypothetical protein